MDPAEAAARVSGETDDALLRQLVAGLTVARGAGFGAVLTGALAAALGVRGAWLGRCLDGGRWQLLAAHPPVAGDAGDTGVSGVSGVSGEDGQPLAGTPWAELPVGGCWHHAAGLARRFPDAALLAASAAEGCLGQPLLAHDGRWLGLLVAYHTGPLPDTPRARHLLALFAGRATAELELLAAERTLGESEERFRDLFDEAPIAYVHEDLQTRFLRANRAAMRTLGIRPDEVNGTYGMSFIPDTPEAQRRVREAFDSVGRGTDTSGVVLELRRRDNGKPLFIQWWSRPDPSGAYTRTMFVDITDRVLLEQEQARLTEQNRYLREEIQAVHNFEEIVGGNAGLLSVLDNVARVAPTDSTVLITGETGTGKELVARAIHSRSTRRDKPLIKLNCAALPTGLVESELFGHEKGAFSGAIARRIGRFELAHGGTIFLDELGEMPLDVQVKLLRVLQEREFERVGGATPIAADVRVIAATNRDLSAAIAEGRFRADLYYRLNVFPIRLPPLRERADDIPLLVRFFLGKHAARIGRRIEGVSGALMERLCRYSWPGNVRELENILERSCILTNGSELDIDSTPLPLVEAAQASGGRAAGGHPASAAPPAATSLEEVEREHIRGTLEATGWVIEGAAGAARRLGLHPNTLRSRMKRLGLQRERRGGG